MWEVVGITRQSKMPLRSLLFCCRLLRHKSDEHQHNTAMSTGTAKHSNWLKNTISTFYNLRLAVISFTSD